MPKPRRGERDSGRPAIRFSAARLAAVQALHQMNVAEAPAAKVIDEFITHRFHEEVDGVSLDKVDRSLFMELVRQTDSQSEELDDMLSAVLRRDWPVERLESLLRTILRLGTMELGERLQVPARVVVAEYTDIAYAFLVEKEAAMANGVLDRLARLLRHEEFGDSEPPAIPDGLA